MSQGSEERSFIKLRWQMVNVLLSYQHGDKKSFSHKLSWILKTLMMAWLSVAEACGGPPKQKAALHQQ